MRFLEKSAQKHQCFWEKARKNTIAIWEND
jgi:hypothetical protein